MKKLIIISTVLLATVAANAAAFQWNINRNYPLIAYNSTEAFSGTVSLYAYASIGQTIDDAVLVSTTTTSNGKVPTSILIDTAAITFNEGAYYNFYLVITDTGVAFDGAIPGKDYAYYYQSDVAEKMAPDTPDKTNTITFTK